MRRLVIPALILLSLELQAQTAEEFYKKGVAVRDNNSAEALNAFKEATKLDPKHYAAWYEMGWCSNDQKKYTDALICLRKSRVGWSNIPKVHFELGYAFHKLNLIDSATKSLKRCLELKSDYSLAYKELGTIAYNKDNYTEALDHFSKFESYTKNEITDYLFWYRKGFMLNGEKRYSEAVTALEKSKSYKADYINTYLELGFAASRMKQSDIAIAHYKKAMEIDPKSHIPLNGIGEVYRDYIKNREEAMVWYRKALAVKPNERKASFGMGYCYNSLGKYNDAIPYLKTAIDQESNYTAAYVEIGYSYYMIGSYTTALEYLDKALTYNPVNENGRYYKVLVFIKQNNKSMAQKVVDELKGLNSKHVSELQEKVNKM